MSAEVGNHSARKAGGETHIVDHAMPFPFRVERLHIGRDGLYARLIGGVHSSGGEIFNLSVQQQPECPTTIWLAKIQFEAVQLGEAFKWKQFKIADVAMRLQIRENVVAMVIPRAGR